MYGEREIEDILKGRVNEGHTSRRHTSLQYLSTLLKIQNVNYLILSYISFTCYIVNQDIVYNIGNLTTSLFYH